MTFTTGHTQTARKHMLGVVLPAWQQACRESGAPGAFHFLFEVGLNLIQFDQAAYVMSCVCCAQCCGCCRAPFQPFVKEE